MFRDRAPPGGGGVNPTPTKISILLSGRGSNFVAIAEAVERGAIPAEIVGVISNRPEAPGLEEARRRGLNAFAVDHRASSNRASHDQKMLEILRDIGAEWVCLAGYMRLLSPAFIAAYRGRILNIHPSLLPAFRGLEAQEQALDYGVKVAGCTVHFVDENLDSGPIVAQDVVPVRKTDTASSLSARILEREHLLYPESLGRLFTEEWRIEGRRVVFS